MVRERWAMMMNLNASQHLIVYRGTLGNNKAWRALVVGTNDVDAVDPKDPEVAL